MNEYKETPGRTVFGAEGKEASDYAKLTGRKPPIIVGSSTVTSEVIESTTDPSLTTADLAGRGNAEERAAAASQRAETAEPAQTDEPSGPLFTTDEAREFRTRWDAIQAGFVDEPRRSVEQADNLVAAIIKRLAEVFAEERHKLEGQWTRGESVSTEDLRLALRRYRSFFGRLLSV